LAEANGSQFKFNYLLKKPTFLATCLFGITFIVLENTAANSVSLAQNLLDAAHTQQTPGRIIAISLAANTLACLLHTISRKWGIILNNVLGVVKFLILFFIFIIGLIWIDRDVANDNLGIKTSFNRRNTPRLPYRYAEAMVYVIYPYGAFHQINYVRTLVLTAYLYLYLSLLTRLGHIGAQGSEESIPTGIILWRPYCSYNIHCCNVELCK
jgi:amino acid transporter